MNKYVCPVCGGQLIFWEEYIFEKQQLVNIRTGYLNKKVTDTAPSSYSTNGLKCSKCNFTYSGSCPQSNGQEYEILNDIFEKTYSK